MRIGHPRFLNAATEIYTESRNPRRGGAGLWLEMFSRNWIGIWLVTCGLLGVACDGSPVDAENAVSFAPGTLTFSRDIAPIIFENCSGCHRPGEAGPFSLLTYEDIAKRGELISTVIASRYMPPWLPEPTGGPFRDERRLSDREIGMITQWVEEGVAEGDAADLPPTPQWTKGWQLGQPDLVIQMTEPFSLPAEGRDVFRNFAVPIPLTETKYVRAFEFRPGNARLVHHARMLFDNTPASRDRDDADPLPGFKSSMLLDDIFDPNGHWIGWTPGKQPAMRGEDMAWRLDPGTDMVVEMHLVPTGKPEVIQSSMGLFFTDQAPKRIPAILRLGSKTMDIAPGDENYAVTDTYKLPVDVEVLNVYAHAHYLGKRMESWAVLPNGTRKDLLLIKQWDFDWQDEYRYVKPVALPAGSTLSMKFTFDNSTANVRNPFNPPVRVTYGWETSREMADVWFQVLPATLLDLGKITDDFGEKERRAQMDGYEKQLEVEPGDYEKRNRLGNYYMNLRRYDEAIKQFEIITKQQPDYEFAHYNLGLAAEALGSPVEAETHYRNALRARPGYTEANNNLGILLSTRGDADGAVRHFRQALKSDPDHGEAHNNLGIALGSQGEFDSAVRHFREALKANPYYAEAYNNLGITLGNQGHLDQAINQFREALRIDSDYADAHNNLGSALGTQGKIDEAIDHFRKAVEADGSHTSARNNLEMALRIQKQEQQ